MMIKSIETGQTMYTELAKLGIYFDGDAFTLSNIEYRVKLNMLESYNGEHRVTLESTNKFISEINERSFRITNNLEEALQDYLLYRRYNKESEVAP